MMDKAAMKPRMEIGRYLKYGFVIMECEHYYCPKCGFALNAGPNYQPKYCSECGQKIDFSGVKWKEEKELGYAQRNLLDQSESGNRALI